MKDLTKGNIYKTFLLFAVPLIASGFLSQAYSIIDTMIAGRILSSDGLGAIGATSAFIQFFSSVFWGYGTGFSIYAARLFGAKEYKKLKETVYINILLMVFTIFLLSLLIIAFKNPIFDLLEIDPSIRDKASVYFIIYMLGAAFLLMNNTGVYIMNAFGNSSFPLFISVLSTALHIGGNLFAVKVLSLGVGGIAASTVISALIADLFYVYEVKKCFKKMGVDKYKVEYTLKPIKSSLIYSVPVMLQQTIMYFSSLVISPLINGIGSAASAAYVICLKIYDINANLYQNSAKTVTNYTAQSIGAQKYENIQHGLRVGFLQGVVFVLPVLILSVANSEACCKIFLSSSGAAAGFKMANTFVRYFLPFIVFNMVNNLFHCFYRGVAAMHLLVISTLIGSVSRIAATYIAVRTYQMNGVYIGWVISWIAECLFSLAVYYSGVWKTDEIKRAASKA